MGSRALTELLQGKGAHADPIACVEDLTSELAARHVKGFPHSIGQLLFHMNYWMEYELRRIRGQHIRSTIRRAFRLPRRLPIRRNGIGCESTLPVCWPTSPRWQILLRRKCGVRLRRCMREIRR